MDRSNTSTERERVEIRLSGSVREFGGGQGNLCRPWRTTCRRTPRSTKGVELLVARAKKHSVFRKKGLKILFFSSLSLEFGGNLCRP